MLGGPAPSASRLTPWRFNRVDGDHSLAGVASSAPTQVKSIIEGVGDMILHKFLSIRGIEESWVYQDIFTKGAIEELRKHPPPRGPQEAGRAR